MRLLFLAASLVASSALWSTGALANLNLGDTPPHVIISGEDGGRIDGSPWDSSMIKDKVSGFFYVDPDEKDVNEAMDAAFLKEAFPKDKYQSFGVINLDATWLPNTFIESAIASKQEKFPEVVYVKDMKKVLVNKWGIQDNAYVVLVFDKAGKLIFKDAGKLSDERIKELMTVIRSNL